MNNVNTVTISLDLYNEMQKEERKLREIIINKNTEINELERELDNKQIAFNKMLEKLLDKIYLSITYYLDNVKDEEDIDRKQFPYSNIFDCFEEYGITDEEYIKSKIWHLKEKRKRELANSSKE